MKAESINSICYGGLNRGDNIQGNSKKKKTIICELGGRPKEIVWTGSIEGQTEREFKGCGR